MEIQELTSISAILEGLLNNDLGFDEYIGDLEKHFLQLEPDIFAFLPEEGRFERLLRDAKSLEKKYPDTRSRPPLYGLPIGLKDIFHVEGFETRAGSQLPAEVLAGKEADCVTALKDAGALILGKTVTTEFAYFAPGPTRNPHNLEHTPGGSSSGSAAAVAAGLSPLTLGTQTIGSISRPASFCGIIGYKPSYDRISKRGVIPLASSVDHVGMFTKDLELARTTASILCQDWDEPDSGVSRPTFGIPAGHYLEQASVEMLKHFHAVLDHILDSGHKIRHVRVLHRIEEINNKHATIVAAEAASTHEKWYAQYQEHYHSKTVELIERGKKITNNELASAKESLMELREHLSTKMAEGDIDIFLSPAALGAAPYGLENTGDPVMNLPWTHSGLPTLTLPSGKNHAELPLGLQLTGGWYQDENLFEWGRMILASLN